MGWALRASTPASVTMASPGATQALTLGAACSVDDRVVVTVTLSRSGADPLFSTPTGTFCGTFTKDAQTTVYTSGAFHDITQVWSAPVTSAGTPVVTIGGLTANGITMVGAAFSGLSNAADSTAVDVSATATTNSPGNNAPTVTTATTNAANELVVGGIGDDGASDTFTQGSGYTMPAAAYNSNGNDDVGLEWKDSGGTGTQVVNGTWGASHEWGIVAVVYKLSGVTATQAATYQSVRTASRGVGPAVMRFAFRQPTPQWTNLAPATNTEFGPPLRIANPRVGPPALRQSWRPPYLPTFNPSGAQTFSLTLNATVAATVTLARAITITRSVTAVSTGVSVVRGVAKSVTASAVAVGATVVRAVALTRAASAVATLASLVRSVGIKVTPGAIAATTTVPKQVSRTITPTAAATTVTQAKQVARAITAAPVSVGVSVVKSIGRKISTSAVVVSTTMTFGRAFLRTISVGVSTGVTLARQVGKPLAVGVAASPTVQRAVRLTVAVPVASGVSVAKQIGHIIAVAVGIVTSESAGRQYGRVLNAVVTVAVTVTFVVISAPVPPHGTLPRIVREWVPGGLRWTRIQM